MKRVIFDTNIYGHLLQEKDIEKLQKAIRENKELTVYGYTPIRKEIRAIPKITQLSRKTRNALLALYDQITSDHFLQDSEQISNLAECYSKRYKELGGTYSFETNIKIDFMVVACASIYGLDIVYSNDSRTLVSKIAVMAYGGVNTTVKLRTPCFYDYKKLINQLRM